MKMQHAWSVLCLFVLEATACGFPRLSRLNANPDGGDAGVDTGDIPGDDGGSQSSGSGSPISLELLAGDIGGAGNGDGVATAARFNGPSCVVVDASGNLYVADQNNHTIRKLTSSGVVTTLAGVAGIPGTADGAHGVARFNFPSAVAVDGSGNVYVADASNQTIRKIEPSGMVTTLSGSAGASGSADGVGPEARFNTPVGVAVDAAGTVYVADHDNHTIRKVTAAGAVTTLAGTAGTSGSADGTAAAARFSSPVSVAVDSDGTVYVTDQDNSTIRKITAGGVVTTLAGSVGMTGSDDGTGAVARFSFPAGVTVDGSGNLYVADQENNTIRKVVATGSVTTLAGAAGQFGVTDGQGATARFNFPQGVGVDSAGNLYVADSNNRIIRKITSTGGVTTLAGAPGMPGEVDGTGPAARFGFPAAIAAGPAGNVYVADQSNHSIRKVTAAGVVTTFAGSTGTPGNADGTGTSARFSFPTGVATDGEGNFYVADQSNHTIRKVTATGAVSTLAGSPGAPGSADGVGSSARFRFPASVAVDSAGNIFVADSGNHTVRRVAPDGTVTTLAGSAGAQGKADGTGAAARFRSPVAIAVDGGGNLYIADHDNATIRKVTPAGTTTTVAGTAGVTGVLLGPTPRFTEPRGLTVIGDSLAVSDANGILRLNHGAQ